MGLVLTLDAEQNTELRAGLELRQEQLKKVRKASEDAGCSTNDITRRLDVVDLLLANTDPSPELPLNGNGRQGQEEMFEGEPSQPIDEALEGVENEARLRIYGRRIDAALVLIAPGISPDAFVDDLYLANVIAARWDDVEHTDEDADRREQKFPHVLKLEDEDGFVWCGVNTAEDSDGSSVLRFYYDILPDAFVAANLIPTMITPQIVEAYRRLIGLQVAEAEPAGV